VSSKPVSDLQTEVRKAIEAAEGARCALQPQDPFANLAVTHVRTILTDPETDKGRYGHQETPTVHPRGSSGSPKWVSGACLTNKPGEHRNHEIICVLKVRFDSHEVEVELDLQDRVEVLKPPFYPSHWELHTIGPGKWKITCDSPNRVGDVPLVFLNAVRKVTEAGEAKSDVSVSYRLPESGFENRLDVKIDGKPALEEHGMGDDAARKIDKQ
jgi:hypothetical protein